MDVIDNKLDIKEGFIHNLPIVVKIKNMEQEFFAVVLNPTDDYLLISPIIATDGSQIEVKEGSRIEVATKMQGMLWTGFCLIVEVLKVDFEGIWLTYPNKLVKVQRRNFLRLEMVFPVSVTIFDNGEIVNNMQGFCHDLSGSGIGLNMPANFKLYGQQEALISFNYKSLDVKAKIKPVYSIKQGAFFRVGCRFDDIDEPFSDRVHKFIIQEQILMKKGGLV